MLGFMFCACFPNAIFIDIMAMGGYYADNKWYCTLVNVIIVDLTMCKSCFESRLLLGKVVMIVAKAKVVSYRD